MNPPHDMEAERAVVASVLVDDRALGRIEDLVSPEDFLAPAPRWAYEACQSVAARNETVNQVTVAHEMARSSVLDKAGGQAFLAQLVDELPTPIGVEHYAQIVRRDARWRQMIQAGQKIVAEAYKGGADVDAALAEAEAWLKGIGDQTVGDARPLSALLDTYWDQPGMNKRATRIARTGFTELDALLGGLRPSNLIIVAAQTGVGKSLLMLHIARNAAMAQNFRSLVFSLEMNEGEWTERLLSHETGIPSERLRVGLSNELDERKAMNATGELNGLPIWFDDRAYQTIDDIRVRTRRASQRHGVDIVLLDYLQLAGGKPAKRRETNRTQEIGEISRGLKLLAREMDVPVVAAAQLNRGSDPFNPKLSDLRESGSIEQDADAVLFLVPVQHNGQTTGLEVRVAKHRGGPTGRVFLRYDAASARIEDMRQEAATWVS